MGRAGRLRYRVLVQIGKLAALTPEPVRRGALSAIYDRHREDVIEAIGPKLNRSPMLDTTPLDLEPTGRIEFEQLAGLFASHQLAQGVIAQPIRQAAYMFGLIRRSGARSAIEVGRWKGGCTVLLAAALGPNGMLWSIDNGEKEIRLQNQTLHRRPFDEQTAAFLERLGLHAELIVGDSRQIELTTGPVDVTVIDGDHSYEGCRLDFDRWGRRVRVGGYVLLDDAAEGHMDTVGQVAAEAIASGDFEAAATVNRLVVLRRVH